MSDVLDALADLHIENEALKDRLEQKQVDIHGLWQTIARAHDLWLQAQLEVRRQKKQIHRLEDLLQQVEPGITPPCSPPRSPTSPTEES